MSEERHGHRRPGPDAGQEQRQRVPAGDRSVKIEGDNRAMVWTRSLQVARLHGPVRDAWSAAVCALVPLHRPVLLLSARRAPSIGAGGPHLVTGGANQTPREPFQDLVGWATPLRGD